MVYAKFFEGYATSIRDDVPASLFVADFERAYGQKAVVYFNIDDERRGKPIGVSLKLEDAKELAVMLQKIFDYYQEEQCETK